MIGRDIALSPEQLATLVYRESGVDVGTRLANLLWKNKIDTISKIRNLKHQSALSIPGFGSGSLELLIAVQARLRHIPVAGKSRTADFISGVNHIIDGIKVVNGIVEAELSAGSDDRFIEEFNKTSKMTYQDVLKLLPEHVEGLFKMMRVLECVRHVRAAEAAGRMGNWRVFALGHPEKAAAIMEIGIDGVLSIDRTREVVEYYASCRF